MGIRYAASSGRATPTRVSFIYHEEKMPRAPGRHAGPNTYVPEARAYLTPAWATHHQWARAGPGSKGGALWTSLWTSLWIGQCDRGYRRRGKLGR